MDHPHEQSVEQSLFLGAKTASKQPLLRGSVSYWRERWRRRRRSKENVYCEDGCTSHGSGDLSVTLQSCPATTPAPWGPREEPRQQQPPYGLGGSQLGARAAAAAAATHPGIHPRQTDNLAGFPLASARRLPNALVAHFMGRSPLINL
ncbi:unnamed protein product [Arctogadus glacialis]